MKPSFQFLFIILYFFTSTYLNPIFDSHFFHAGYFWNEPRFSYPGLQTVSFDISGSHTTQSRNGCGKKVPLFDLHGSLCLQLLAQATENLTTKDPIENILQELAQLPSRANFSCLALEGITSFMRFDFKFYQNLHNGLFFGLEIPAFEINTALTGIKDLSPLNSPEPSINTHIWQQTLRALPSILSLYSLETHTINTTTFGDSLIVTGYSINYDEHPTFDFLDGTVTCAGLIPTGHQASLFNILDYPNGYNGHFGIGLSGDGAVGLWDWLTLGVHASRLKLIKKEKQIVMPGPLIPRTASIAKVNPGSIWRCGFYGKADHVIGGFSLILGYSFEQKSSSTLENATKESCLLFSHNPHEQGFSQQTFHLVAEYDATSEYYRCGPRISFFFNHSIDGRNIFITNVKGGYCGLDIRWAW